MNDAAACLAPIEPRNGVYAARAEPFGAGVEDVVEDALAWLDVGKRVATATVIKTWGSAPCPVGSQLAVNEDMAFVGSVSGGCLEAATVRAALDAMADGRARRLSFGPSSDSVFDVGLPCGGTVEVYVECVTHEHRFLERLRDARAARRSLVVATSLNGGHRVLLSTLDDGSIGADGELVDAACEAARHDRSRLFEHVGAEWFLHVRHPARRLVVVGAVHVAQVLAAMAMLNGFQVVVVDPRPAFLTPARFPNVELLPDWPHEVMSRLGVDHRTAVVTLAHDPKLDDPALAFAARSPAFYVGALGSRRAHAARLERLAAEGLSTEQRARIRGPVGLPIGASTVSEIATSIVAELVQTLRQATP